MIHGYRRRRTSARRLLGVGLALLSLFAFPLAFQSFSRSVSRLSEVRESALSRQPAAKPVAHLPEPAISLAKDAEADVVKPAVLQPKPRVAPPTAPAKSPVAKAPAVKKASAASPARTIKAKQAAKSGARLAANEAMDPVAQPASRATRTRRLIPPK